MIAPDENNSIFQLATDFVNQTSEHVFLTGKAGTGKTTFLKYICQHTHKITVVTAPTGVAAINAGGVTLHSFFQLPLEPYIPGYSTVSLKKNFFRFSKQKIDLIKQLELLIIDEVSMLRADILDSIDVSLRSIRHNLKPFGGVQVLYIGDMFQLPPVAKEEEWNLLKDYYQSTFFFHAQVFQQTHPVYLELKKVYRQGDSVFVDLLNRIRNNIVTGDDIQILNKLYNPSFVPSENENYIILTTHNYRADSINNVRLSELPGEERIFSGEITGDFPNFALPTDMQLRLKPGAQIMFIKNDTEEHRYYNGKIGVVSRIVADQIHVYLSDTNDTIILKKETWENKRFELDKLSSKVKEEILGSFIQYPIRLAWAITIHKSQGLTFEKAIIDTGSSFAAGQTYVALSRCTSLDGIVLYSKIRPNCILTDPYAIEFSQNEKAEQELMHLFGRGKRKFWMERLLLYFNWKPMYAIIRQMEKLLEDKERKEYQSVKVLVADYKQIVGELEQVALKFQNQLLQIVQQEETDHDISVLKERCRKAVVYYHQNVVSRILIPLQNCIRNFKTTKKTKSFHRNLIQAEEDIILFLENMKKVRYDNLALAEDLSLPIPSVKHS
jgi:nucleoside-triphosphatase THEP1